MSSDRGGRARACRRALFAAAGMRRRRSADDRERPGRGEPVRSRLAWRDPRARVPAQPRSWASRAPGRCRRRGRPWRDRRSRRSAGLRSGDRRGRRWRSAIDRARATGLAHGRPREHASPRADRPLGGAVRGRGIRLRPLRQRAVDAAGGAVGRHRRAACDQSVLRRRAARAASAGARLRDQHGRAGQGARRARCRRADGGRPAARRGGPADDRPAPSMFEDPPGALLPFAQHKGFALAVMCELLGGALSGGRVQDHAAVDPIR